MSQRIVWQTDINRLNIDIKSHNVFTAYIIESATHKPFHSCRYKFTDVNSDTQLEAVRLESGKSSQNEKVSALLLVRAV